MAKPKNNSNLENKELEFLKYLQENIKFNKRIQYDHFVNSIILITTVFIAVFVLLANLLFQPDLSIPALLGMIVMTLIYIGFFGMNEKSYSKISKKLSEDYEKLHKRVKEIYCKYLDMPITEEPVNILEISNKKWILWIIIALIVGVGLGLWMGNSFKICSCVLQTAGNLSVRK
jgi:hypothetical protein